MYNAIYQYEKENTINNIRVEYMSTRLSTTFWNSWKKKN